MTDQPMNEVTYAPITDGREKEALSGRYGRRALMLGAATGVGVAAASTIGATAAGAAQGDAVLQGEDNTTGTAQRTGVFSLNNDAVGILADGNNNYGVQGQDNSSGTDGIGVLGQSVNGIGVEGTTSGDGENGVFGNDTSEDGGIGVYGESVSGVGVKGFSSDNIGVFGYGTVAGIWGTTDENNFNAVVGTDTSENGGYGVVGSSIQGTGVYCEGPIVALHVEGVATFSRSGSATVPGSSTQAHSTVKVTGVALSESSLILATPQTHVIGVGVAAVVPDVTANTFTIQLTESIKVPMDVAWFIVG